VYIVGLMLEIICKCCNSSDRDRALSRYDTNSNTSNGDDVEILTIPNPNPNDKFSKFAIIH